jgi:RimJ/RimL family protein N-acetyltransferase
VASGSRGVSPRLFSLRFYRVHPLACPTANRDDIASLWVQEVLVQEETKAVHSRDVQRSPAYASRFARWREQWATAGHTRAFALRLAPGGELVGGCELRMRDDGAANMSYWTLAPYRRRGLATRAVRIATGYGFDTLHVTQIELQIEPGNVASLGVARCAGFTEAGTIQMSAG